MVHDIVATVQPLCIRKDQSKLLKGGREGGRRSGSRRRRNGEREEGMEMRKKGERREGEREEEKERERENG